MASVELEQYTNYEWLGAEMFHLGGGLGVRAGAAESGSCWVLLSWGGRGLFVLGPPSQDWRH